MMPYSKLFEHIWDPSKNPTYIVDRGRLVTIKGETIEQAVGQLKSRVDSNIKDLKDHGIEVKALYFGKTYLIKEKKVVAGNPKDENTGNAAGNPEDQNTGKVDDDKQDTDDDDQDTNDDDQDTNDDDQNAQVQKWNFSGLSSRWKTSHSEPKRNEIQGKRNMIVLANPITDDDVPDDIKAEYEMNKKKAKCAAEYYTLLLEKELHDKYENEGKQNLEHASGSTGKLGKNEGYTLYMRITHRKILKPEEQEVRSISICCFALYLYILTVCNHTLHVTMIQKSEYQVILQFCFGTEVPRHSAGSLPVIAHVYYKIIYLNSFIVLLHECGLFIAAQRS